MAARVSDVRRLVYFYLASWLFFALAWLLIGHLTDLLSLYAALKIIGWALSVWAAYRYRAPLRHLLVVMLLVDAALPFGLIWLADMLPLNTANLVTTWPAATGVGLMFTQPLWLLITFGVSWDRKKRQAVSAPA